MSKNYNNADFDQEKEEADKRRLNNSLDDRSFIESEKEMEHLDKEKNPSSSIYDTTAESDDKGDKNEKLKSHLIPQENEVKKYKIEKVVGIPLNNVQNKKKHFNLNLNESKKPVKSTNMDIENGTDKKNQNQGNVENQSMEIAFGQSHVNQNHGNDEKQNMEIDFGESYGCGVEEDLEIYKKQIEGIDTEQNEVIFNDKILGNDYDESLENDESDHESDHESDQDEQETNFTTIAEINVNYEGVVHHQANDGINQYVGTPNTPIEDDDMLNSSVWDRLNQIECNH
jgi:transposase-like protein